MSDAEPMDPDQLQEHVVARRPAGHQVPGVLVEEDIRRGLGRELHRRLHHTEGWRADHGIECACGRGHVPSCRHCFTDAERTTT